LKRGRSNQKTEGVQRQLRIIRKLEGRGRGRKIGVRRGYNSNQVPMETITARRRVDKRRGKTRRGSVRNCRAAFFTFRTWGKIKRSKGSARNLRCRKGCGKRINR